MAAPGSQDRVGILDGVLLRTTAWTQRCTHCGPHCLQTMSCSVHGLGEFYAEAKRNWLMHCRARDSILRMHSTSAICIECARAEAAWVSARKRRCAGQVCLRRLRGPRTWPHQDQDRVAILDGVLLRTTAWTQRCTHCELHSYEWSARGLKPHGSRLESVGVRGRSACDGCEGPGHGRTSIKIELEFLTVCCFALRLGRNAVRTANCTHMNGVHEG